MRHANKETGHAQRERGAREPLARLEGAVLDVGFSVFVLLLSVVLGASYGNAMLGSIIGILGALAVLAIVKEIQFHRRRASRPSLSDCDEGP